MRNKPTLRNSPLKTFDDVNVAPRGKCVASKINYVVKPIDVFERFVDRNIYGVTHTIDKVNGVNTVCKKIDSLMTGAVYTNWTKRFKIVTADLKAITKDPDIVNTIEYVELYADNRVYICRVADSNFVCMNDYFEVGVPKVVDSNATKTNNQRYYITHFISEDIDMGYKDIQEYENDGDDRELANGIEVVIREREDAVDGDGDDGYIGSISLID